MNQQEETLLRENIRELIKVIQRKKHHKSSQIQEALKELMFLELQSMVSERSVPDVDPTPNKSTGINVLEDLLKKIVPQLEMDYKQLTTNPDQRQSFRSHIVNAVIKTLSPVEINDKAGDAAASDLNEQDIEVNLGGEDDDKFIDIRTDAEKKSEEEDVDPREDFAQGVEGQNDETGRNMAYNTFHKIETSVVDSYQLLSNEEDQELFYDYLIANLKLYFDKFEAELEATVPEPTNQAYDTAAEDPMGGELGGEEGEEELDIEL